MFQAGPRVCLGMNLAIFEIKLVIASILQDFSVRLPEDSHLAAPDALLYKLGVTLSVKGQFSAIFTPRDI